MQDIRYTASKGVMTHRLRTTAFEAVGAPITNHGFLLEPLLNCWTVVPSTIPPHLRQRLAAGGIKEPSSVGEQRHSLALPFSFPLPPAWASDTAAGKRVALWGRLMELFRCSLSGSFNTEYTSPSQCSCCPLGGACRPAS